MHGDEWVFEAPGSTRVAVRAPPGKSNIDDLIENHDTVSREQAIEALRHTVRDLPKDADLTWTSPFPTTEDLPRHEASCQVAGAQRPYVETRSNTRCSPPPRRAGKPTRVEAFITAANADGFHAFDTADRNMPKEVNLQTRRIAVIVLTGNNRPSVVAHAEAIFAAITQTRSGQIRQMQTPHSGNP